VKSTRFDRPDSEDSFAISPKDTPGQIRTFSELTRGLDFPSWWNAWWLGSTYSLKLTIWCLQSGTQKGIDGSLGTSVSL
jgi:hypothetical protein